MSKANFTMGNIIKGSALEDLIKILFENVNYKIKPHSVTQRGLDITTLKGDKLTIVECLNWYGGYIHPKRFLSLIRNLSKSASVKFLVSFGVKPTKEQLRILKGIGVKVIHYPTQLVQITHSIVNFLNRELGVITYYSKCSKYSTYTSIEFNLLCNLFSCLLKRFKLGVTKARNRLKVLENTLKTKHSPNQIKLINMTPRKRKYESDAERQKAYRERKKKQSIGDKLKKLFNGKAHGKDTLSDTPQQPEAKPNGTILIYDKFTGKRIDNLETKPKESSVKEALNSEDSEPKIIRSTCLYCNTLMSYSEAREDERCRFCRQFETKEQALYEREIMYKLRKISNRDNVDLIPKYEKEMREGWQCKCKRINPYYVKACLNCGHQRGYYTVTENRGMIHHE